MNILGGKILCDNEKMLKKNIWKRKILNLKFEIFCDEKKFVYLKLKLWHNKKRKLWKKSYHSKLDKTQKLKLWQISKTEIVTKKPKKNTTQHITKLKNSKCDKT